MLAGYYAILDVPPTTSDEADHRGRILKRAARLLAGRPCMLQLRAKHSSAAELAIVARLLLPGARAQRVPLCVNDRLDVALAVGADAVHLGQDDLPLAEARLVAAGRLCIGISTHSVSQARAAAAAGADYIGFGPIFATASKANPDPIVGVAMLREVCRGGRPDLPVVAIGGITLDRVAEVAATGAAAAALIAAIESAPDPVAAALFVNAAFREIP